MSDQDRQRVCLRRADVQEVDVEAVDRRAVLIKSVQHRLAAAPVVVGPPVVHERAQLGERHALRPVADRLAFRPARPCQTLPQVIESALRRVVGERRDRGIRECAPHTGQTGRGDRRRGARLQHRTARHGSGGFTIALPVRSELFRHDPCSRETAQPKTSPPVHEATADTPTRFRPLRASAADRCARSPAGPRCAGASPRASGSARPAAGSPSPWGARPPCRRAAAPRRTDRPRGRRR